MSCPRCHCKQCCQERLEERMNAWLAQRKQKRRIEETVQEWDADALVRENVAEAE